MKGSPGGKHSVTVGAIDGDGFGAHSLGHSWPLGVPPMDLVDTEIPQMK